MNLKQTVYFMWLVGGIAGLICWTIQVWLSEYLAISPSQQWMATVVYTVLMGALIGGMTVGFADKWASDGVVPKWVVMGVLLGSAAGVVSGLLAGVISQRLIATATSAATAQLLRTIPWTITGSLIGLVTGLRWASVNPLRTVHAFLGGLLGGALGGIVAAVLPAQEWSQALAFILTGMGITLGVTLAPVLLSDGILVFVSSGDPRAQNKYASPRQEWVVQDGDRLTIGSQGGGMTATMFTQDVQIYIPDAMVGPKHAILFAKGRRFFIQLHPENMGPHGQPIEPLQLGDENVSGTRELRDGDEIVVGQTLLRFTTRKRQAELAETPPARQVAAPTRGRQMR